MDNLDELAQKYFEKLDEIYSLPELGELEKINAKICGIQLFHFYNMDDFNQLSLKDMNNLFRAFKDCKCCERHQTSVPDELDSKEFTLSASLHEYKTCPCPCRMVRNLNKTYMSKNKPNI